jgi:hypothetical protein
VERFSLFDRQTVSVRLSIDEASGMADPYALGNVGVNILRDYRLIFDYPHQRIALVVR